MNLKKHSNCLSQAIPPIKSWLHGNKLNYLALAVSVFPIVSPQIHAATENNLNQTVQSAQSDKVTYQGVVIDENGNPLPGVNITYKNAHGVGVITDIDGKFTLEVTSSSKLQISFVGYKDQIISGKDLKKDMIIVLKSNTEMIDELVVVGYGTQKKVNLTGAVASVSTSDIQGKPVTNIVEALQGTTSGLVIQQSNSAPGARPSINIRGLNTMNNNDPMVLIDGIIGDIQNVNPSDIENISVLKDASSTAIYGSRGSNGVVLVTTKTGLAGATQVTLDASFGVANVYKRYDLLNSREYAQALADAGKKTQDEMSVYLNGTNPGIDWQDEIFRTGITQNYKVAVSSGNDKTQFYLSGNYMGQTGVVIESKNERYQAKANVTSQVTPWLHVTADVNASHNIRKGGSFATGKDNPIWIAMNYSPTMQMMDGNNYAKDPINSIASNPVGILRLQGGETMTDVFTGHVDLRFNLAKGLTFTTTNGVDYYDAKSYSFSSKRVNPSNSMGNSDTYRMMLQSSNNFTYMGKWNKHSLTSTAVYEVTKYEERLMNISGKNLLTESVGWWDASMAQSRDVSNGIQNWALVSGVTRVMYNYNDRYQLTGTFRADGSSRFSKK